MKRLLQSLKDGHDSARRANAIRKWTVMMRTEVQPAYLRIASCLAGVADERRINTNQIFDNLLIIEMRKPSSESMRSVR